MNTFQFGKTILKLNQSETKIDKKNQIVSFSPVVFQAIYKLIDIIAQLRLPQAGWPSHLPQTAENLLPYVTEEAYEVLDVLQLESLNNLSKFLEKSRVEQLDANFIFLEDLIAQLLWYFAKTSETIVRLLSGTPAQVQDETNNFTGTLRLVAILAAKSSHQNWQVDLATQQPICLQSQSFDILPETPIQFQNNFFSRHPITVSELLEQLWQEIHQITPELSLFQSPLSASWLKPESSWQMGNLQLKLDVEFICNSGEIEKNPACYIRFLDKLFVEKYSQILIENNLNHLICSPNWKLQINQLKLNQVSEINQEISITEGSDPRDEIVVENLGEDPSKIPINPEDQLLALDTTKVSIENVPDRLEEIETEEQSLKSEETSNLDESLIDEGSWQEEILEDFKTQSWENSSILSDTLTGEEQLEESPEKLVNEAVLLKLISLADHLADHIQINSIDESVKLEVYPLPLDDVIHQLLWYLIRSRYEIMQLVGGISAGLMQPNLGWMEGILKLRPTLKTLHQTPIWEIDLTTGQIPSTEHLLVLPEAVIYSPALSCFHQPVQAQTLLNEWIEQLSQTTPEVTQWMAGVAVEWDVSSENRHLTTLQLNLALEFQKS